MLRAFGVTDRGRVRPTNQDRFRIAPHLQLCIVADGLGGHNAGEVAAQVAVDAIIEYVAQGGEDASRPESVERVGSHNVVGSHDVAGFAHVVGSRFRGIRDNPVEVGSNHVVRSHDAVSGTSRWPFGYDASLSDAGNLLRTAVYVANIRVLEAAVLAREYSGMGTTIVAALVREGRLSVAHVGDSRLYLRQHGQLRQMTLDDSWITSVIASDPDANRTMLEHHPMRHALTNVVGARTRTRVHVTEQRLTAGDMFALTTDGVHGVLDDRRILQLIDEAASVAEATPALVRSALARGSQDNCTAVVAQYAV
jgi:protein phosphatase